MIEEVVQIYIWRLVYLFRLAEESPSKITDMRHLKDLDITFPKGIYGVSTDGRYVIKLGDKYITWVG